MYSFPALRKENRTPFSALHALAFSDSNLGRLCKYESEGAVYNVYMGTHTTSREWARVPCYPVSARDADSRNSGEGKIVLGTEPHLSISWTSASPPNELQVFQQVRRASPWSMQTRHLPLMTRNLLLVGVGL